MAKTRVLIVEDEPVNQDSLTENLEEEGYEAVCVATGAEAWNRLTADPEAFAVILLDRLIPDMDGIDILRRIKSHPVLAHTPVIMETAMTDENEVVEGLRAGAYYYLTKPFAAETLLAIVAAAAADHREFLELQYKARESGRILHCLESARFSFRTPEEAREVSTLAANAAPDPERVVLGLCELLVNAVEHGNLGIGYQEKSRLIEADLLNQEISRRLASGEWGKRRVELRVERTPEEIHFLIRDEGAGFDWQSYVEMSPARAFHTHGRGIAMSRLLSFDRLEYRGRGNEVLAVVRR